MVKMTKKAMKIVFVIISVMMLVSMITPVFAIVPNDIQAEETNTGAIQSYAGKILGVVQAIGVAVAVIIVVVIGVKYLMGSAEEKAEYKKTMIPYIVGAALVAGGPTIANAIYTMF